MSNFFIGNVVTFPAIAGNVTTSLCLSYKKNYNKRKIFSKNSTIIVNQSAVKKVIILGGGFGGIRTALDLANKKIPGIKVILISDKPHFEYHPALYRIVGGHSPLEVCIPLRDIFEGKNTEVLTDSITEVNLSERTLKGSSGSRYSFDFLILALGSETVYFNIPGLKEFSFGFKSITEALTLKQHLHELFQACIISDKDREEDVCRMHFVVVGGGASGVELTGELAIYTKGLAEKHQVDSSLITIDLIELAPRLLPTFPADVSKQAKNRLHELGINIFLNRGVTEQEVEEVHLKDIELKTETVIWTAGVKPNKLYGEINGLSFDKNGRVLVDEFLQARGWSNIFAIGDGAATPYTGMAQTAIRDGKFVAELIHLKIHDKPLKPYKAKAPFFAIPIGHGWAALFMGNLRFYGRIGWWLRRFADFRFFVSILSLRKAILVFRSGKTLAESCAICAQKNT